MKLRSSRVVRLRAGSPRRHPQGARPIHVLAATAVAIVAVLGLLTHVGLPLVTAGVTSPFDNPNAPHLTVFLARNSTGYAALERWVLRHSDPMRPSDYNAPHLTKQQINAMVASHGAHVRVAAAAEPLGWHCRWDGGDVTTCVNANLMARVPRFSSRDARHVHARVGTPVHRRVRTKLIGNRREVADHKDAWVVPDTVARSFGVPLGAALNGTVGVIEFQNSAHYCPSDLAQFRDMWGFPATPVTHVGAFPTGECPGEGESSLDIQWVVASAPRASAFHYYFTAGWIPSGAYEVFNARVLTDVLSASYGWCESCQADILPGSNLTSREIVQLSDDQILKSTARGTTWVVASGDSGCNGRCHEACSPAGCCASYPGSSQWVTAAGGLDVLSSTTLHGGPCGGANGSLTCAGAADALRPCVSHNDGWTTGGAASNFTAVPEWQRTALDLYLDRGLPLPRYSPAVARYSADTSAPGHLVQCVVGGQLVALDGTSAAAPIVAGWLLHLGQALHDTPRARLGFFNPLLYVSAAVCPQCTVAVRGAGNNDCTETTCCPGFGYNSTRVGWDPLTGVKPLNVSATATFIATMVDGGGTCAAGTAASAHSARSPWWGAVHQT